jgi:hypothetical protein
LQLERSGWLVTMVDVGSREAADLKRRQNSPGHALVRTK